MKNRPQVRRDALKLVDLVLVVNLEKDNAVVRDAVAIPATVLHLAGLPAAQLAPVINQTVIPTSNVFFQPAVKLPVHPTIGICRVHQQSIDHLEDPGMPGRILAADSFKPGRKVRGGVIKIPGHGHFFLPEQGPAGPGIFLAGFGAKV
jgi:hypothetical protein